MSRQRCFTLDEALAELMGEDDDDFLAGAARESSSSGESSGSDSDSGLVGDPSVDVSRHRSAICRRDDTLTSGGLSSCLHFPLAPSDCGEESGSVPDFSASESENFDHFLDREIDPASAAGRFVSAIGVGSVSTSGVSAGQSGISGVSVVNAGQSGVCGVNAGQSGEGHAATAGIECRCNQGCLKKFSCADIDLNRLNMQELSKDEKDLLLMGIPLSTQFDKEKTCRGKRKHESLILSKQSTSVLELSVTFMISGKKP